MYIMCCKSLLHSLPSDRRTKHLCVCLQILKVSAEKYKVIIDHAKTCSIGENLYMYNSMRCGREVSAIFNVVGCLRGLLYVDKYVPIDKLSEDEKV